MANIESKTPSVKEDNIFKELSADLDFGQIKDEIKKDKKDIEFYLKQGALIFSIGNIVLFLVLLSMFLYIKVQNNSNLYASSFLNPICGIILGGDIKKDSSDCSSLSALSQYYAQQKANISGTISEKVVENIRAFYSFENFLFSDEVSFLLQLKNSKLPVLGILNDFDVMKNTFTGIDKKVIDCTGFQITGDNILTANCTAYSSFWTGTNDPNRNIMGETGNRNSSLEGTSMTIAASFLNFIEKNPNHKFRLLEKPTSFQAENIIGEGDFVKQTKFNLKLQYSDFENNLSF